MTEIWLANPDERTEISQAAANIDRLLGNDPNQKGELRIGERRIEFVPPLVVVFSADELLKVVRILTIRHLKRRGSR